MEDRKIAVVTGAGGGIGRAICFDLAGRGAEIVAVDRNVEAVAAIAADLRAAGHSAREVNLDLTDGAALDALVADTGRIDILVNNAGVFDVKPFTDLTGDDFRRNYEVNVVASAELIRRALPRMPSGGAILNIASVAMFGAFNFAHYAASKAAVGGLTKSLALEFASRGIRVNAVAPGAIKTPMLLGRNDGDYSNVIRRIPLGHFGEPEDIAAAVGFLTSDQAKYITGVVLVVDGGRVLTGMPNA